MAIQRWLLFVAAMFVIALMVIAYSWGYDRGGKSGALAFAQRSDCRGEFAAWAQEARDHVTNGQGTTTQAEYRGLKQSVTEGHIGHEVIVLGDGGDREITKWQPILLERQATVRRLSRLQEIDPGAARAMCAQGPPG